MVTVACTITIDAPLGRVAEFFDDPVNFTEVWPSLLEVTDVEDLPNGGHRYNWVYKMAGVRFKGASETVELVENERIVQRSAGGIDSVFTWQFKESQGGVQVDLEAEYEIPSRLLAKVAEPFVTRMNEREAEAVLANLKDRLEA